VGGAVAVLRRARWGALGLVAAALVAYSALAESLPELARRWDVAVAGAVVLPLATGLIWLALPLSREPRRHPAALPALAGAVAVVLGLAGLDSLFGLSKLACFALVGLALVWIFDRLWWLTLVAALIPWIDIWSVAAGPTRHVIEERPSLVERLAVGIPFPGESSIIYLGPPDVIFFALFLGAAQRFGLRIGWTWAAMTGFLTLTLVAVVLGDVTGLPALPAVCLGFLLPNADRLARDALDTWRARGARETSE
jgi:hypothetical protein